MECSEVFCELRRVSPDVNSHGFRYHPKKIYDKIECLHQVLQIYWLRNIIPRQIPSLSFLWWSIYVSAQIEESCSLEGSSLVIPDVNTCFLKKIWTLRFRIMHISGYSLHKHNTLEIIIVQFNFPLINMHLWAGEKWNESDN